MSPCVECRFGDGCGLIEWDHHSKPRCAVVDDLALPSAIQPPTDVLRAAGIIKPHQSMCDECGVIAQLCTRCADWFHELTVTHLEHLPNGDPDMSDPTPDALAAGLQNILLDARSGLVEAQERTIREAAHRIEVLSEALAEIADRNGADGVFGRIANTALQGDTRG